MRKQLKDMTVKTIKGSETSPLKSWGESGPEWGGKINFSLHHMGPGFDATPLLPGGFCPIPHFGYCVRGRLHVRYQDGAEEVIQAGDLFYMPPGHTFTNDKDAPEDVELIELTEFSEIKAAQAKAAAAGPPPQK
jgi:Cupin domain